MSYHIWIELIILKNSKRIQRNIKQAKAVVNDNHNWKKRVKVVESQGIAN